MGDNYRLFLLYLYYETQPYLFIVVLPSPVLPVYQEENKETFKLQETYIWGEVFYGIQTRGLDIIHTKRKAKRWKKSNDLLLQQTLSEERDDL